MSLKQEFADGNEGPGQQKNYGFPRPQGLYNPLHEKDACGAGFICHIKGEKSHDVVQKALGILVNLTHRGACGFDERSGDGAGILLQIPDAYFQQLLRGSGIILPAEGDYAVGMVFLPTDADERQACMARLERAIRREKQHCLGWREVPVDPAVIGDSARTQMPAIFQVFIGKNKKTASREAFERHLYLIRKTVEKQVHESELQQKQLFYVASLSSRTIVYKGMLLADQVERFYADLREPSLTSALALVHQRYSTNTFPTWDLAQPFRYLCHNGEINTMRGNVNWMNTREKLFRSEAFGDDIERLFPVIRPGGSDSAALDNALEVLHHSGRSLPHSIMMMIPEAWQHNPFMDPQRRAFYQYHSCLMEPWDGPAFVPFTNGDVIGAVLDRNGLRPARYTVTKDDLVIMASETGVIDIAPDNVSRKGRLEPGRMFLVDIDAGRLVDDAEIKSELAARQPYQRWLDANLICFEHLPRPAKVRQTAPEKLLPRQQLFGYSLEDLNMILSVMARDAREPLGSMGDDTPLAVLSHKARLLYDYFKQLFAQVTNPPLDAIREEMVTALESSMGRQHDIFRESPEHCHLFHLEQPVLTNGRLEQVRQMLVGDIQAQTLGMLYDISLGLSGLNKAIKDLCYQAEEAVDKGISILILSDRSAGKKRAPIPALLATAAVHHHLIRKGKRTRCGIVVESGEPREVHHFCVLLGYGASAINPYLAFETLEQMQKDGVIRRDLEATEVIENYIKAISKGILKVMSKMGISTLQSYQGAQIFEIVGLSDELVDTFFNGTISRIGGIGLDVIAEDIAKRHMRAYTDHNLLGSMPLAPGGKYQWRRTGERHHLHPQAIAKLQHAARSKSESEYREFARMVNEENEAAGTLRSLLQFRKSKPIPLEEVEPWTAIVRRFKTGAMSYGSLSKEAHETLAVAMNRIGGRSNSGEGGEDPARFKEDANGDLRRSAIKQIASGRFGVTSNYLINADELQIKMAQGAKPGEGGQLPGYKVYPEIARTRYSTPYVGLISPPPHHDIYSIEDLSQLIFDLKNANPAARINVKLVSQAGVGTVAAGVAKGKADVVLISGSDGGTGASPLTSLKHCGLPWELGIAEAHQTLILNKLRNRIVIECDGQLKTGRDVAIAALLGAEEYGFATAPLVAMGCIMMRVCHLNTCPVGIATQDPELREKFAGQPEHVINYLYLVSQELREIMALLGFRTLDEMIGRTDMLTADVSRGYQKAANLDLSRLLFQPEVSDQSERYCSSKQVHDMDNIADRELIEQAQAALENKKKLVIDAAISNTDRSFATMLSSEISKRFGEMGLPEDSITLHCKGSAGQSFCAFGARGLSVRVEGDANDYFGKGLSGSKLILCPPRESTLVAEENIILGNVAFYGATSGEAYIRGRAGERFCVRNSGLRAVVEGVGDHGCEYMTGGVVVVLGNTGRNFAAGMSGGMAFVLDIAGDFATRRCNLEMVELESVVSEGDKRTLLRLIESHYLCTGSEVARRIRANWDEILSKFVKVMPVDYKRALKHLGDDDRSQNEDTHQMRKASNG